MVEKTERVTDFGITELTLLDGTQVKIRSLTFKEKKTYLKLIEESQRPTKKSSESGLVKSYIDIQLDVVTFLLQLQNKEITREIVEEQVNGEIVKKVIDIAFYDPFSALQV